jgi:hypothetical protein
MDKIKKVVNSPLFVSAVIAAIAIGLLIEGDIYYSGIASGIAALKFIESFK